MLIPLQIVVGTLSFILLLITLELIRKERLREEYSILWLFTGVAVLIFSLWPNFILSKFISGITGLHYLSGVVIISFIFLLLIVFHFSIVISKLTNRNKELAQKHALLELEFRQFKERNIPVDRSLAKDL
jgi:hypothetical protein